MLTNNIDRQWATQDVGETVVDENGLPALVVRVTDVNRHSHLNGLVCSYSPSFRRARVG